MPSAAKVPATTGFVPRVIERLYGYDIFISYARLDDPNGDFALSLQAALEKGSKEKGCERRPLRCFLDRKNMPHDDALKKAIENIISASRVLVIIAGPNSADHEWICFEAAMAVKHGKRIIVIDRGIGWADSSGRLKQTVGDVLAIPGNPGSGSTDLSKIVETIGTAIGKRRVAVVRQRVWLGMIAVLALAVAAAFAFKKRDDDARQEMVRENAFALYKAAIEKIPAEDDPPLSPGSLVRSDEPVRNAMALLAQATRLNPDYLPAAAALSHLIHAHFWPRPLRATTHHGILSSFMPCFAGGGRWLITCPKTDAHTLQVTEVQTEADPVEISLPPGEEIQCFSAAKFGRRVYIGTRQNKLFPYDLEDAAGPPATDLSGRPLFVVCSQDGSRAAIGCDNGLVRLRIETVDQPTEFDAATDGPVRALAIDHAGEWLAALGPTGKLFVWKCDPDGLKTVPVEARLTGGTILAFHQKRAVLAAGSGTGVRLFDLLANKVVGENSSFSARSFFTSPLGSWIVWGRERQKPGNLFDPAAGPSLPGSSSVAALTEGTPVLKAIHEGDPMWKFVDAGRYPDPALDNLGGFGELGTSSDVSPTLQAYAAGNEAYLSTTAALLRRALPLELIRMPAPIQAVVAAPDGDGVLLSDTSDAVLWQPGAPLPRPLVLYAPGAVAAAFSHDSQRLAVMQENGELKVWNCSSGLPIFTRQLTTGKLSGIAWNSDDQFLGIVSEKRQFFRVASDGSGELLRDTLPGDWKNEPKPIDAATRAAGITGRGELGVWDLKRRAWSFPPLPGFADAEQISVADDEKVVGVLRPGADGRTNRLQFFSLADGKAVNAELTSIAGTEFNVSGRGTFVAVDEGETYEVRRVSDNKVVWTSVGLTARIARVIFSPDENRFVTEAVDSRNPPQNLQVWKLPSGQPLGPTHSETGMIDGRFTADSRFFIAHSFAKWTVLDGERGMPVAKVGEDLSLSMRLGGDLAKSLAVNDPAGCWRATQMGKWIAISPLLPDFSRWNTKNSEQLAALAECLAQETATSGGSLSNLSPRDTIAAIRRIDTSLTVAPTLLETRSDSWNRRIAAWQIHNSSAQKISPWTDANVIDWVDQTLACKDSQADQVIESMGDLGETAAEKVRGAVRARAPASGAPAPNENVASEENWVDKLERMAAHNPALALQILETVVDTDGWAEQPVNRGFRGYLRSLANRTDGAVDLTAALKGAPDVAVLHIWQARVHFVRGLYQEALAEFDAVSRLQPETPPRAGQAACRWKLGENAKALKLYKEWVAVAPSALDEQTIVQLPVPASIQSTLLEIRAAFQTHQ